MKAATAKATATQRPRKAARTAGAQTAGPNPRQLQSAEADEAKRAAAARLQAALDAQFGYLFDDGASERSDGEQPRHEVEDMRSDGDDGDDDDDDDDDEFEGASGSEDIGASDRSDISGTEAPVVVVDDSQSRIGLASAGSRHDWKDFMSSKISKVSGRAPQTRKPSKAELEQDRQDEEHDRELNDLLKTSKLIESYTASELTGKDRINYQKSKLVELGAVPAKAPKAPLQMRLGMRKKAEERARKKLQEAKDMGMYHSSLRTQIMGSDFVQKSDKDRRKKRSDVGIIGSIGRIKDGVMHVSKKHIDSVNSPGGSARGKRRRGAGAGDPTASLSVSGGRRGKSGGRSSKRTRLGF